MRKACIELHSPLRAAYLIAGEAGTGKTLLEVRLSAYDPLAPDTIKWQKAIALCQQKAVLLKYEVTVIRGQRLAGDI
ncbi:hypothetical protein [Pantoea agglomerans]